MILLDLVRNLALLVALAATSQVIEARWPMRRLTSQFLHGLLFGAVGLVGMMTPVHFLPGIIFDGRSIILSIAGLFGGPIVALIAAFMCGAYRLWLGGAGSAMGLSVILESAALGVAFHYWRRRTVRPLGWAQLWGFGLLVHGVMLGLVLLLPGAARQAVWYQLGLAIIGIYPVATMLVCLLFLDYEKQRRDRVALEESEERLRSHADNSPLAVVEWNADLRITQWTITAEKMFGWSAAEAIGQPITEFPGIYEEDRPGVQDVVRQLAGGGPKQIVSSNRNRTKSGQIIACEWYNSVLRDAERKMVSVLSQVLDVTERKRAEEMLRESERKLRETQRMAQLGHWVWDVKTGQVEWSEEVFNIFRLNPDKFTPRIDSILALSPWPEDHERDQELIRKAMASHEKGSYDQRFLRPDGSIGYYHSTFQGKYDDAGSLIAIVGTVLDITERKQAEEALKLAHARLQLFVDANIVGIVVADAAGHIIEANDYYLNLIGYTREELEQGKVDWRAITPPEWLPADEQAIGELRARGRCTPYEKEYVRRDGTRVAVLLADTLLPGPGDQIAAFALDVTERKRAEEALRLNARELAARNDELQRFTYTVSHDLKSPLVTIQTFAGYLERDIRNQNAAQTEKDLEFVRGAADKMSRLLSDLLDLSRVGRKTNPFVEVSLQTVVQEALTLVAGRIAQRGVMVSVTAEPVLLHGDRPRLVEVFQNLVDNAVKFMGDQPAPRVEIGVERSEAGPVFFVRDNGLGIDPRHQAKLFGLFEKLDPRGEGTGIGLALVKRIVEVHGGKIWMESAGLGQGVTFRFTLAVPGPPGPEAPPIPPA